mgnify:CR=1 FL=1|jgi:hypothetical protein|tara:strand:+ start:340 stop:753 length:414 start_codon:yes stop_codon:yes gene_type:complete
MASTIIIKNGTGSAIPSSLSQGELAINVDSGSLYYGVTGGTAVSSSFYITNLTASNDISSSGTIIGRTGSFTKIVINSDNNGSSNPPFLIKIADTNGQDEKLQVNHEGVLRFGALDTLPTAITGGLVYKGGDFYMGL